MEKNPSISIIIPTWNTAKITLKCVNTIKKFLPQGYAQIIVVDNGSTDNTQKLFSSIKNIIYIKNSSNLGFSKANNIGVTKATGEYLLFLNSDMELIDTSLLNLVKFSKNNPNIGLIGPRFLNPDLSPQGSVCAPQTPLNAFKEFWLKQVGAYTKYTPITTIPLKVWSISGGAVLVNRKLFKSIGGWNEKYHMYFEDFDLCRTIRKLNKDIYYYPSCQVIHRHGASGKTIADNSNQWRRLIPSSKIYFGLFNHCLLYTSPSPRDRQKSRMPSSA